MALDVDPDVVGVLSQPFWIHWRDGTRHAPDYFVRRRDGSVVVVDVREDDRISDADRDVFDRSAATCAAVGWDYQRVGALDPVLRANLRWLSGCRVIGISGYCGRAWLTNSLRFSPVSAR